MEHILEAIINHIGRNMPMISTVDEDCGQLEFIDQDGKDTYPVIFPAVLVDSPDCDWSDISELNQIGKTSVRIRLALDVYDDTHYGCGTTQKIRERMQLVHDLHEQLQGYRFEDSVLTRTQSRFYTANHGIKVYEQTYSIRVHEEVDPGTEGISTPRIKVKIV